jgi:hypothetical protein
MAISYFNTNPDVARAYEENQNGMTPDAFANYHYVNYGGKEGRAAPTSQAPAATTPAPVAPPPPTPPAMTVNDLYTQYLGRAPDEGGLAFWQGAFGAGPVTAEQQASFMQAAQVELANRPVAQQQQLAPNLVNNQTDLSPQDVQKRIIDEERKRAMDTGRSIVSDGIASLPQKPIDTGGEGFKNDISFSPHTAGGMFRPVDLGNGTFRTANGSLIDKEGYPVTDVASLYQQYLGRAPESQSVIDYWKQQFGSSLDPSEIARFEAAANTEKTNTKAVNDLYASIGRTGMGTETNQIDQAGFEYWNKIAGSGLTPEQLKQRFNTEVNQFLIDRKDDPYSKFVAPTFLKSITDTIAKDTTLSAFDRNNKIFETAQQYGMDDAAIDKAFGKEAADAYRKDYGSQIKSFITTSLAKDEGTTFDEIATIKNEARTRGLDSSEIAKYSGLKKDGVDTLFDAYDKGLANLAKGFEDAKTKAGTDATALSEAEANKAKTMLTLQSQYKVTDEDLAKAGNTTVKAVQDYLNPVKEAPKTLEALMNDTKMSAAEIRAKIEELKSNPAVDGIYGAALQKFSEKAAKDYSGSYGGKNYESLNPIAVSTVLEQLKAQQAAGTAQYYQGGASGGKKGGFGSLDAMTEDMAKNLVAAGITDIRQVGEIPVYTPVEEMYKTYNGKQIRTQTDEDGKTSSYIYEPTGKMVTGSSGDGGDYEYPEMRMVEVPKDAKLESVYGLSKDGGEYGSYLEPVDSSKLTKDKNGKIVTQTSTAAGNKVTGELLSKASNYAERTTGDSWSGTFRGKGNTGYNVQFKNGNPIFYTSGASSSDMGQLAPILAIASFVPQLAPFVAAINAAYAASEGNWKGALLSALPMAGGIADKLGASAGMVDNINSASKIANVANAIDNKDLLSLAMSGVNAASDKNMFGEGAFNPKANVLGNFSTKDLLSGASIAKAIENKDLTSLANIGAQMSGSSDAVTAAKGLSLIKALESKNPMAAIAQVASQLNLNKDVIGKAGGGLASLPGLIKNGNKNTLTDKTAFDGLGGSLVAKLLNQQPPAIREAMLKKMTQAA